MAVTYLLGSVVYLSMLWIIYGQTTTVSQSGCSYTFLVSKQNDNSCPVGSVESGPNDEEVEYLKSLVKLLTQSVQNLQVKVEALEEAKQVDSGNNGDVRVGTNYVRWGRTVCPQTAQLIYQGLTHYILNKVNLFTKNAL